jgi:hypothetical protein
MPHLILPGVFDSGDPLIKNPTHDPTKQVMEPYVMGIHTNYTDENSSTNHGYMSSLNGRLDEKNFFPDFHLKDYHIQPRQASLAGSESMITTNTFYGNGIPNTKTLPSADPTTSLNTSDFFTVPGCSFRWYQPFVSRVSLLQWSVFLSQNSWRGIYKDLQGVSHTKGVNTLIFLRCVLISPVGRVSLRSTERVLAQNMFHPQSPGGADRKNQIGPGINTMDYLVDFMEDGGHSMVGWPDDVEGAPGTGGLFGGLDEFTFLGAGLGNADKLEEKEKENQDARGGNPKYVQTEAHSATHYDFHSLQNRGLSRGFNEIRLECAISQTNTDGVYLQNFGRDSVTSLTGRGYFNLIGKVGFGIRNARVLNLI